MQACCTGYKHDRIKTPYFSTLVYTNARIKTLTKCVEWSKFMDDHFLAIKPKVKNYSPLKIMLKATPGEWIYKSLCCLEFPNSVSNEDRFLFSRNSGI